MDTVKIIITLSETLSRLNTRLYDLFGGEISTTISAICYLADNKKVDIFTGGGRGWITEENKLVKYLSMSGDSLGRKPDFKVAHEAMEIEKGSIVRFIAFTDGVLESSRDLKRMIVNLSNYFVQVENIDNSDMYSIVSKAGVKTLSDDRTMVVFEVKG